MYRRVKGWERLPPEGREAVRALAAWREREALAGNKPPQWLLRDAALLEVARKRPESIAELRQVRGVPEEAVRRFGREILAVLVEGADAPPAPPRRGRLPAPAEGWGAAVAALVQARCRDAEVAPRFVASRTDAEELARWWWEQGSRAAASPEARGGEPDLPLLAGWRRELAGQAALDWLSAASRAQEDERGDATGSESR
jgi:ribonuclease D